MTPETALELGDEDEIDKSIQLILLLHGVIMSFGGIPLLYYGDEIGTINDYSYLDNSGRASDNRWMHRPRIDWEKADRRKNHGTVEQRIFDGIHRLIAVRKTIPSFADYNNRTIIDVSNEHLFAFIRYDFTSLNENVLVIANFDDRPQKLDLNDLGNRGQFETGRLRDMASGEAPARFGDHLVIPPYQFYWLSNRS